MTQQLQFDLTLPAPAARRSDPSTSHTAARRASAFSESHAGRIYIALVGLKRATAHELSKATGLTVVQIDRRLPELRSSNLARVATDEHDRDVTRDGFRVWCPTVDPTA